ncbi:MAG TPA: SDR family NAD(P)-dependent oxidoreductase [Anaerolineaceae bacterium]|nr:SDR family NAD(P)-dependent oxidoreductase [Anaerolineaceae bacterium]
MSSTAQRFIGKTAIVTGAGSGIGRATAIRLAREGAKVIAVDMVKERLDQLVADEPNLDLVSITADLTDEAAIARIIQATGDKLDVLVNNAGIMDKFQSVAEVDDATWDEVFAVNLVSVMKLTRAAIPLMIKAGKGAIVNVSSEAGLRGSAAGVAYTASKHAVIGLTKSTALLHAADGIRTNAIAPGGVKTNIQASMGSKIWMERMGKYSGNIQRIAEPEELAAGIAFLASDEASNFNGVVIPCDGGWSAI